MFFKPKRKNLNSELLIELTKYIDSNYEDISAFEGSAALSDIPLATSAPKASHFLPCPFNRYGTGKVICAKLRRKS